MSDDFVRTLVAELRGRLDELEAERGAIERALRELERGKTPAKRLDLPAALLKSIRSSPGSRGSFLALEFGVSIAAVTTQLRRLEERGQVVKRGQGWDLADSAS